MKMNLFLICLYIQFTCYLSEILQAFRQQVAVMQHEAVAWHHRVIPKCIDIKAIDYMGLYVNMLFTFFNVCLHNGSVM